jgi:phosphoglycerate dehydrogenase-like enzyme
MILKGGGALANLSKKGLKVLVCTQYDPTMMEQIRKRFPSVAVDVVTDNDQLLAALPSSDILYLQKEIPPNVSEKMGSIIAASKKLKWIHWGYTGLDRLRPFESVWHQLSITTSKGIMAGTIADYVIVVIHLLHRDFLRVMKNQMNKVWERWPFNNPRGKTVGIVGLGSIGKEVSRRARFFGMKVIGLVRRPISLDDVDSVYLQTELKEFLGRSDIVVLSVPLTPETRGFIGEEALSWMKPKSYLINVARGRIVEEEALVRAIKSGHLAGAALDAFVQEPLSPDSELWSLDNVIITPHLSGFVRDYPEWVVDLFCENLERFVEGKDLINVFKAEKGY